MGHIRDNKLNQVQLGNYRCTGGQWLTMDDLQYSVLKRVLQAGEQLQPLTCLSEAAGRAAQPHVARWSSSVLCTWQAVHYIMCSSQSASSLEIMDCLYCDVFLHQQLWSIFFVCSPRSTNRLTLISLTAANLTLLWGCGPHTETSAC